MKESLQKALQRSLETLRKEGVFSFEELPNIEVSFPKDESFGDYTSNVAMVCAKFAKMPPLEMAKRIVAILHLPDGVSVSIAPPGYINFLFDASVYRETIDAIFSGSFFSVQMDCKERIMVEYSQPNTLKEFHIGHLRNVFLGSAIVNVLRSVGHEIIAANYIGDTGTHIGKCLWGLRKFHSSEDLENAKNKGEFLGSVYAEATKAIAEHPEYEEESRALQMALDQGDPELNMLWKKTREWSLQEFKDLYQKLDISFDEWFFESEEEKEGKRILPELLKQGIVEESDGAVIANLDREGLGVLVLVRRDGAPLYGLKDIPLAKRKFEEFKLDRSIYVVDVRQSLYFRQLFAVLTRMGFVKPMIHVGYEAVGLSSGEGMSSRKGNVILARTLIDRAVEKVREQFPDSPDPFSIAVGAIRFSMLKHSAESKILFDIEEATTLHGATGPYVQYAYARMSSIERKAESMGIVVSSDSLHQLSHSKEVLLLRIIMRQPEILQDVARDYGVHRLAHYAIEIADAFHSFYDHCIVLDESDRALSSARLSLVRAAKTVLSETLRLMGVSAPEKM